MKTPAAQTSQVLDLTNCEREPIHVPGAVQPHGALLVLTEPELRVARASENVSTVLGIPLSDVLGKRLAELVDDEREPELTGRNPHRLRVANGDGHRTFDGIAHRFRDQLILELEPSREDERAGLEFTSFYHQAREAVQSLRAARSLAEMYASAVSEVRRITGFDRVLIYKFDEEWSGHVLSEQKREGVASYLDLHFPASDIPRQARELYALNRLRLIPTVDYVPSRILPAPAADGSEPPVDLSLSVLRSVSPIHLEYLRNMGATASMSVSIMKNNRLWGLISCTHESGALYVPYDVRAICDFVAETLSSLLPLHETEEDSAYRLRLATVQGALLHAMTQSDDFVQGLLDSPAEYLGIANASGGAICYGGECHAIGAAPPATELRRIVDWLATEVRDDVFATTSLAAHLPGTEPIKGLVCGLLAFSISKSQANYFLWFRPEVIQTVNWSGNPNKVVDPAGDPATLHPRKSFELWKETVRLRSLPWREEEKQAVGALRASIIDIVLQRIERITRLNEELARSNTELDSFAYAASHDLKEPLRGIHNYASIVLRAEGDKLSESSRGRMQTIIRLTRRSEDLINSLLHYSQLGRTRLILRETDLNEVARNALEALKSRIEEEGVEIHFEGALPKAVCDRVQIIEVYTNLVSNAIKYNDSRPKRVEIGALPADGTGGPRVLFVRDNGIGIDPIHHGSIFKIFKRLHAKDRYGGGTGTGLTITQKIVENHGGRIWVESSPGQGTTFLFTLGEGGVHVE